MFTHKRKSLLYYWTSRYVLALVVGLTIVTIASAFWLRHTTLEYRLDMLHFFADMTVNRITNVEDEHGPNKKLPDFMEDREGPHDLNPTILVIDDSGQTLSSNRPLLPGQEQLVSQILEADDEQLLVTSNNVKYYSVKKKITYNNEDLGYVIAFESRDKLTEMHQEYGQLSIFILTLALIGWGAIYYLSRRLSSPIKKVARAANYVQNGHYDIDLPVDIREKEVYDLVSSFKDMAKKLEQLEMTRTELLAGVTHELKTPVTSISALLQAVRDGVVAEQDAKEFIEMAFTETTKLKTMVGDLLAFNSFAVDAIPINISTEEINQLVEQIVNQWIVTQTNSDIQLEIHSLPKKQLVQLDIVRFQQILINLLTNALQAMEGAGRLEITLQEKEKEVEIYVRDTGNGIPEEEQELIFERFYRGESKKYKVRGLGLGLSLSKMMAQSIQGDLQLVQSSTEGTIFCITVLKAH